jgi:alkanesulfonate monooxygenase SsuD/methylene tetrahydromethanopterin reductase-like flavin-dependent oxidoreductase (luciferase family)
MKLGMFMMPLHPPGKNYSLSLQEDKDAFILADRLGFDCGFVGEHVTDAAETVTSCMMFLAHVASETKQIKLGSGTINLPNSHPANVAAQVAMIDHLLKGRFLMGISPGGLMSDAEVFGNYQRDRNAMFVEGINMVLDIWKGEPPYNLEGQFWKISTEKTMIPEIGQGIILQPLQKPHPPIYVMVVAPYSKGVTAAAERGWLPVSGNFLLPKWQKTHWPSYAEGRKNVGATPDPADWTVAKSIFVADDAKTARAYGHGPDGPYAFYFTQLMRKLKWGGRGNLFKPDPAMPDSDITLDFVLKECVIAGTVDQVVEQILAQREFLGPFGRLMYACHDWIDPALGRRSMELMATEVMPRVNKALGEA